MEKIKLIISIIVSLLSFLTYSQQKNSNTILGFACGGTGNATKAVHNVYQTMVEKKFQEVTKLLYSKSPAEKFLAVIICEKLAEKRKIELTQKDLDKIKNLYHSDELVHVCGGCTFEGSLKMSVLLNAKEDLEHVREEAVLYFNDVL